MQFCMRICELGMCWGAAVALSLVTGLLFGLALAGAAIDESGSDVVDEGIAGRNDRRPRMRHSVCDST